MERSGRCMCGAVTYTATFSGKVSACHCDMCRQWTGGPLLAAGTSQIQWSGDDQIQTYTSSPWAERGFCKVCGSSLFYRVTAPGPHQGTTNLAFGTVADATGFDLNREWYIDKKPALYTLEGERESFTEAQVQAMFGGG